MQVDSYLINNARSQRKSRNPWENKLWNYLRASRFYGLKFKRQVPIGNFIVDFCCHEKRLIIELDGGGHNESKIKNKDLNKEQYLKSQNYQL